MSQKSPGAPAPLQFTSKDCVPFWEKKANNFFATFPEASINDALDEIACLLSSALVVHRQPFDDEDNDTKRYVVEFLLDATYALLVSIPHLNTAEAREGGAQ